MVFFVILVMGGFFYITTETDPQQFIFDVLQQWDAKYVWIVLIVFGLTVFSTLTGLPVFYLMVALGFFMSFLPALGLSWLINLVAIMTTYFVVKKIYSSYFINKYGKKKIIQKINKRMKKYGLWTIVLTRSVYIIPTNIINFSFPLSKITIKQYTIGTMLGLIPECLINVTIGYLLKKGILLVNAPEQNLLKAAFIAFFLLILVTGYLLYRYLRNRSGKGKIEDIVPLLGDK
jgi:uncharacterized membrane protein YdjX (TVP38/TMEM64 family)